MKNLFGYASFVLVLGGLSGLVADHLWGLRVFGFVRHLVPADHQTAGYCALIGLGVLLGLAAAYLEHLGEED